MDAGTIDLEVRVEAPQQFNIRGQDTVNFWMSPRSSALESDSPVTVGSARPLCIKARR
jgi:hypothetical protein